MILDLVREAITQNIGPLKQAPNGWNKRNCPLCHTRGHTPDKRQRFGIRFEGGSIAANCFNCGFRAGFREGEPLSSSFKHLLKNLNIDENFIKHIEFELFKNKNHLSEVREGDKERAKAFVDTVQDTFNRWKTAKLPEDSEKITTWLEAGLDTPDFLEVVNYALSRQIYDLDNFYWTPTKAYNLNRRLIIPYYYKNRIVGFTARLSKDLDNKSIPKYYQQCPHDYVYNLDPQADYDRKFVIVNEGVLDAWSVDGVGILGEVTQPKIDIINRLHKEIIVCPDRDKKGGDLVNVAIENNWAVAFPKWDRDIKDASKAAERYGRLLTTYSIVNSAVKNKDKIKVMWEIMINERK